MKTAERFPRQALERVPALVVLIRRGSVEIVDVALTDIEGQVCGDLRADLATPLEALAQAIAALNR